MINFDNLLHNIHYYDNLHHNEEYHDTASSEEADEGNTVINSALNENENTLNIPRPVSLKVKMFIVILIIYFIQLTSFSFFVVRRKSTLQAE